MKFVATILVGSMLAACSSPSVVDVPEWQKPPTAQELKDFPPLQKPPTWDQKQPGRKLPSSPSQKIFPSQQNTQFKATDAIVKIKDKSGAWGSGTIISEDGLLVTAAHVARYFNESNPAIIELPNGKSFTAKVITIYNKDIALMKIENLRESIPFISLADPEPKPLQIGETVSVWGYCTGKLLGKNVKFIGPMGPSKYDDLEFSPGIDHGDSGGPVFNAKGEIVGVGVAYINASRHTIVTSISNLKKAACTADGKYCAQSEEDLKNMQARDKIYAQLGKKIH